MRFILPVLLLVLSGCASVTTEPEVPTPVMPSPLNCLKVDHAPTPFSAEELRAGIPNGCELRFRIEQPGTREQTQVFRFDGSTEKDVTCTITTTGPEGRNVNAPFSGTTAWIDLQSHASFPVANTVLTRESHTTPMGTSECWLYVVTSAEAEQTTVSQFWFDPTRPGPPVEHTVMVNGKLIAHTVMTDDLGR